MKRVIFNIGFVKVSKYRTDTLKTIGHTYKMPTEIARETEFKTSQVSCALIDLKKKNLVICLNEDAKKGSFIGAPSLAMKSWSISNFLSFN